MVSVRSSMEVCSFSFRSVRRSIAACTSLAFPPMPNSLLKPPKDTVFSNPPIPFTREPPICLNRSPLRILSSIPVIALKMVSINDEIIGPIPSFSKSSMERMADMICPMTPALDRVSDIRLMASPTLPPIFSFERPVSMFWIPSNDPCKVPLAKPCNPSDTMFNPSTVSWEALFTSPASAFISEVAFRYSSSAETLDDWAI